MQKRSIEALSITLGAISIGTTVVSLAVSRLWQAAMVVAAESSLIALLVIVHTQSGSAKRRRKYVHDIRASLRSREAFVRGAITEAIQSCDIRESEDLDEFRSWANTLTQQERNELMEHD
jgi:hypothetical protein